MKRKSHITAAIGVILLFSSTFFAQAQESDDMYFRKSDRKKNNPSKIESKEVTAVNSFSENEDAAKSIVVYETVSAKNINPEYIANGVAEAVGTTETSSNTYFEETFDNNGLDKINDSTIIVDANRYYSGGNAYNQNSMWPSTRPYTVMGYSRHSFNNPYSPYYNNFWDPYHDRINNDYNYCRSTSGSIYTYRIPNNSSANNTVENHNGRTVRTSSRTSRSSVVSSNGISDRSLITNNSTTTSRTNATAIRSSRTTVKGGGIKQPNSSGISSSRSSTNKMSRNNMNRSRSFSRNSRSGGSSNSSSRSYSRTNSSSRSFSAPSRSSGNRSSSSRSSSRSGRSKKD